MNIDYTVEKYTMRDAAVASGFTLNTLRSLYGREHFQIVGGEAKKGRGFSAQLTFEDVMCIAVAKAAIDAGVHPRTAFEAGKHFAYFSEGARGPSHVFPENFTVLVMHPAAGTSNVLNIRDGIGFADLFGPRGPNGRLAAVVIYLNDVERSVFSRLNAFEQLATAR